MSLGRILACLAALLTTGLAFSRIVPAAKPYYTDSRERLLDFLSTNGLPSSPTLKKNAFLYLSLGPARFDFFALAKPRPASTAFAIACEKALRDAGLPELVVKYSKEGGLDVLDTDYDHYRFGQTSSSISLDIGAIRRALAASGYEAEIVLEAPDYALVNGAPVLGAQKGHRQYFDLAKVNGRVTSRESIGVPEFLGLAGFLLIVPGIILIAFSAAARIAKRELPADRKLSAYKSTVMSGTVCAMGIHLPVFLWFFASGAMSKMTDLWFGTPLTSLLAIGLMVPLPFLSLAAKRMRALEAPMLGTTVAEMDAKDKERQRLQRPGLIVAFAILALSSIPTIIGVTVYHQPRTIVIMLAGALVGLMVATYMEHSAKRRAGGG